MAFRLPEGCPGRLDFAILPNNFFQIPARGRNFDSTAPCVFPHGVLMSIDRALVDAALAAVTDPNTGLPYAAAKNIRNVAVEADAVSLQVVLGYPAMRQFEAIRAQFADALRAVPGVVHARVEVSQQIAAHTVQRGVKLLPNVKNIVAVASGKGGVGKSTTAVNLALALASEGASVGVLDADIYGPSLPMMLGITGRPESPDDKSMNPMTGHGLQASSIGFLIEQDNPMVWRGPMATSALEQLLRQTNWHDLDYLIVDMPPGTGDIALLDAKKGLKMFEKVGIPILGIVENMGMHICSNCGHEEHIFGAGGGERMGKEYGVDVLGSLPLDIAIREQADSGKPTVVADPNGRIAEIYRSIARKVAIHIAERARDMTSKFPNIVVQNT
jgi:ATP-binding protein involved in chromosome partitioning